jgi:YggT family protein
MEDQMAESNLERNQALHVGEQARGIAAANQNSAMARIVSIIYFLFGALLLLLAVRVVLHVIGANADNSFAGFVDGLSAPFVALFANLVQNPTLSATSVLEVTTLIAMAAYAILAWLIGRVVWLALSRPR